MCNFCTFNRNRKEDLASRVLGGDVRTPPKVLSSQFLCHVVLLAGIVKISKMPKFSWGGMLPDPLSFFSKIVCYLEYASHDKTFVCLLEQ